MCSRRVEVALVAMLGLAAWLARAEAAEDAKSYTASSTLVRLLSDEDEAALSSEHFPPLDHEAWEAVSPTHRSLSWDTVALDEAIDAIGSANSTALLILYRGRIVVEQYWQRWNANTAGTMASVSKSITAVLIGIAQEKGLLSVDDPVSVHLGEGWSGADRDHEARVTIRHLLGMTSGLTAHEQPQTPYSKLVPFAPPGTTWHYSNAAYYRLHRVLEAASGARRDAFAREALWNPIGVRSVFYTASGRSMSGTARDLARFGLLIMHNGSWDGREIIKDKRYLGDMLCAGGPYSLYGYLWWLNGGGGGMSGDRPTRANIWFPAEGAPSKGSDQEDRKPFCSKVWSAPEDMVAARGNGGKCLFLIPSEDLIVVRHGHAPEMEVGSGPAALENFIWDRLARAFRWSP